MSEIIFNDQARQSLCNGVDVIAKAVISTLGPKGRNVVINGKNKIPHVTKDGVTVAKAVELKDEFENIGAQLVKQASIKTCDEVGDGTTSTVVLTQALIKEGLKYITAGANPIDVKRGIDAAVKDVIANLKAQSIEIGNDFSKIKNVASISANNDSEIGGLIANALEQITVDGILTVDESKNTETYIEVVNGAQYDRGYISSYFITDYDKLKVELTNPYVLITDKRISAIREILPVLEQVAQEGRSLFIVAEDIEGEALSALIMNKLQGNISIAACKAPSFGKNRILHLEDIATMVGATVISQMNGNRLDEGVKYLGTAKKITSTKDNTIFICDTNNAAVSTRVKQLKNQVESAPDFEKEVLEERIAKLVGGVGVIYVGAATEVEMQEKRDRVDDALCATKAAIAEGIVSGGGYALYKAGLNLHCDKNDDFALGYNLTIKSTTSTIKAIAENAGQNGEHISHLCAEKDLGFNANTMRFSNLIEDGVIDPTKVVRVSFENAASIAGMFLLTECAIN